ncbi:helix-turn-helix domain-containing protein [Deinococcus yunweiensis]|uniref:helix-turn-helix domain-containing protein n=1 Tax=Deinococcus yunweiensis TaxID=367282 RepID=UPI00398F757F
MTIQDGKHIYTPEEARAYLGIGRNLVYKLIESGQLRAVRAGTRLLIPATALTEFLAGTPPR